VRVKPKTIAMADIIKCTIARLRDPQRLNDKLTLIFESRQVRHTRSHFQKILYGFFWKPKKVIQNLFKKKTEFQNLASEKNNQLATLLNRILQSALKALCHVIIPCQVIQQN